MQPGPALQAVLLAVLLAEPRGSKGRLLSALDLDPNGGQLVCRGGTRRPCYKVIYFHDAFQRLNFEEAKEACRNDGGQLVSIETEDEQRLIEKFIENLLASDGDFWIGLRRLEEKQGNNTACQDLYAWTDGSTSQFRTVPLCELPDHSIAEMRSTNATSEDGIQWRSCSSYPLTLDWYILFLEIQGYGTWYFKVYTAAWGMMSQLP